MLEELQRQKRMFFFFFQRFSYLFGLLHIFPSNLALCFHQMAVDVLEALLEEDDEVVQVRKNIFFFPCTVVSCLGCRNAYTPTVDTPELLTLLMEGVFA